MNPVHECASRRKRRERSQAEEAAFFKIRDHFPGQFVDAFVVGVEFDFGEEEVSKEKAEELRKFRIAVARKKF